MFAVKLGESVPVRAYTFFLSNIAPFSIIYCLALVILPLLPPVSRFYRIHYAIEGWLLAEALFYGLFYLPYRRHLHRSAVHPPPPSRSEREELFRRCNATVTDQEAYLRQWFRGAKREDIKRKNVKEFVVWAFFNNAVTDEDEEEIEGYLQGMEAMLGKKLPPGRGPAKSLRLTLDDVGCSHRSLLWYWVCFLFSYLDTHADYILAVHLCGRQHNVVSHALQWLPLPSHCQKELLHRLPTPSTCFVLAP